MKLYQPVPVTPRANSMISPNQYPLPKLDSALEIPAKISGTSVNIEVVSLVPA